MRSILLASAAICLTAGAAMAQTSPAPAGAPSAAMSSPNAAPGNMAPGNGAASSATTPHYSGQNSITKSAASVPAPTGSTNAAQANQPNGSGTANNYRTMGGTAPAQPMHTAMTYQHAMTVPSDADARTYLQIAAKAISRHDKMTADDALSHAETRLLTRAVPASDTMPVDNAPSIRAIENARQALSSGDYAAAASDTNMAMHGHREMMGNMSPMSGTGAMGGPTQ